MAEANDATRERLERDGIRRVIGQGYRPGELAEWVVRYEPDRDRYSVGDDRTHESGDPFAVVMGTLEEVAKAYRAYLTEQEKIAREAWAKAAALIACLG
jgi:hypothetical protein